MNTTVLKTAARFLIPIFMVLSFFLLIRGHNEPGGGFIGGLVASSALALYLIAAGLEESQKLMRIKPIVLITAGLLVAFLSTVPSIITGLPFMTAFWINTEIPVAGKVGTPLLFDLGVYLLVIGITTKIIFNLAGQEK